MIEREIIIGLIVSTEYHHIIKSIWNNDYIESPTAKKMAGWCVDYFEKYNKAPGKDIRGIYHEKVKQGLDADLAEEMENNLLPDLSSEYEQSEDFNVQYLKDRTKLYFKERKLTLHNIQIEGLLLDNKIEEAEELAYNFQPFVAEERTDIDLSNKSNVIKHIRLAFEQNNENLIKYTGALGRFWNDQLVRGGFVSMLAEEKRGKTFMLIDLAMRAAKQGRKVVFFQAGDMTKSQWLRRVSIYLTRKSDKKRYIGEQYEPVKDCIYNQLDTCEKEDRTCHHGIFEDRSMENIRTEVLLQDLIAAYEDNPKYTPCYDCESYAPLKYGVPWVKKIDVGGKPLKKTEAQKAVIKFFVDNKRNFKLSTHSNGSLSVKEIKLLLAKWKREDGFEPEVIITDYADLFDGPESDFRHKQNEIWKGHRAISQENNEPLVITVTQADAASYNQHTISRKNFSEDKRKLAHVTAMYGLNQDVLGREKAIGIMRINEILIREGEPNADVTVLQNLRRGRPVLGSYFGK